MLAGGINISASQQINSYLQRLTYLQWYDVQFLLFSLKSAPWPQLNRGYYPESWGPVQSFRVQFKAWLIQIFNNELIQTSIVFDWHNSIVRKRVKKRKLIKPIMNFRLKKGQKLFFDYFIYRAGTDYKFIGLERLKSQSQRSREVLAKNKKEKKMQWGKK